MRDLINAGKHTVKSKRHFSRHEAQDWGLDL
jgi:hypothetical protein